MRKPGLAANVKMAKRNPSLSLPGWVRSRLPAHPGEIGKRSLPQRQKGPRIGLVRPSPSAEGSLASVATLDSPHIGGLERHDWPKQRRRQGCCAKSANGIWKLGAVLQPTPRSTWKKRLDDHARELRAQCCAAKPRLRLGASRAVGAHGGRRHWVPHHDRLSSNSSSFKTFAERMRQSPRSTVSGRERRTFEIVAGVAVI